MVDLTQEVIDILIVAKLISRNDHSKVGLIIAFISVHVYNRRRLESVSKFETFVK